MSQKFYAQIHTIVYMDTIYNIIILINKSNKIIRIVINSNHEYIIPYA